MKFSRLTGLGIKVSKNMSNKNALVNFYSLKATSNNGEEIQFEKYRGKQVLLVNLASQCGYTPQYTELEQLNQQNKNIIILGFPSNNFGAQEPGSDEEIAEFCKINYGVTFQLFTKNDVKGKNKQPVYQWLTESNKNGWNHKEPTWNFYKYLVDEKGNLSSIYSSSVSPLDITL
ncbi:glutathione peroxidase [Ginsengibacter hankyongi]|uniref:Glutathione peroxidase n=1 Tax=Ginsengibacter hankyongi TaxID=2607284 RepID=A0A5J5IMC1_9BACT|nr:glutathione peroxidase [Ginsengibacter hankyongi]KAA9042190.1 glutathione peroxidase [Ginsengibacter hankyongi]